MNSIHDASKNVCILYGWMHRRLAYDSDFWVIEYTRAYYTIMYLPTPYNYLRVDYT